jgi:phosphatidylglycerophosphatase A
VTKPGRPRVTFLPPKREGESRGERSWNVASWIVSLWFGCGLTPKAPGTAGTLGALPLYLLVRPFGLTAVLITAVVATAVAVIASSTVARISGLKDPQFVCVDEVAGVLFTWAFARPTITGVVVGFALFRLFDMWKPFPARNLEKLPGGFGIVMDDVAAGCWGAVVLVLLGRLGWV